MPLYEIRPIDRRCKSYRPGHQVHWIQGLKSGNEVQPVIHVSVVVHSDGQIDLIGKDLNLAMWNHDPARLREALGYEGRAVWKPRFHVLTIPGPSGYVFNMATLDRRTLCKRDDLAAAPTGDAEDILDRLVREARDYGGFTARLRDLRDPT